jgi:hypothetical protein
MPRSRPLLVLAILALAACKKGPPTPRGRVEGLAARALEVLPSDLTYLGGVSFAGLRDSKLYGRLLAAARAEPRLAALEKKVKEGCGIDVARDVTALVIAGTDLGDPSRALLLLQGTWTEEKANRCLVEVIAPAQGATMTVKKDGKITEYTSSFGGPGQRAYAAWLAADTVLIAPYAAADRTYLADVLSARAALAADKRLVPLVRSTDTTATVWVAATAADPGAADALADLTTPGGARPAGLYLDVHLGDRIDGRVGLRYGAERDARAVADKVRRELDEAKRSKDGAMLRDAAVAVADRDIQLTVRLDERMTAELLAAVEPYLGELPGMLDVR